MTPDEYRFALKALGLNQMAAARFLHVQEQRVRRYANGSEKIYWPVAALLTLMLAKKVSVEEMLTIMGENKQEAQK